MDPNELIIKIFIGVSLSYAVRHQLAQSKTWKQAQLISQSLASQNQNKMYLSVHFHGKDYLGLYCENSSLAYSQLQIIKQELLLDLHTHCPELDSDTLEVNIFPQLFIS